MRGLAAGILFLTFSSAQAVVIIEPPPPVQEIDSLVNDDVRVQGGPTLNIVAGGDVTGQVEVRGGSTLNLQGGRVGDLAVDSGLTRPVINIFSGVVGPLGPFRAFGPGGEFNIFGGLIDGDWIVDGARVLIAGGTTAGDIAVADSSRITVDGGAMDGLNVDNGSRATINGGSLGFLEVGMSTASILGGDFTLIESRANGTIDIFGRGLFLTGTTDGLIFGELADGTSLGAGLPYRVRSQGIINLIEVPEPATWLLITIGLWVGSLRRFRGHV